MTSAADKRKAAAAMAALNPDADPLPGACGALAFWNPDRAAAMTGRGDENRAHVKADCGARSPWRPTVREAIAAWNVGIRTRNCPNA